MKDNVRPILKDPKKDQLFQEFVGWKPKEGEIMLYTDYCSHHLQLPITFDTMIEANNPDDRMSTKVRIPYCVIDGWAAIDEIELGHHHLCLLQFEEGVPDIITNLPELNSDIFGQDRDIILFNQADNITLK